MEKQILAVVSFSQFKVKVLVAQFFNTKFNVLKVEQVSCDGFDAEHILNEKEIVTSLKKAFDHISVNLGASITNVIMCVPSVGMDRYHEKVKVVPQFAATITNKDIILALRKAMNSQVRNDKEIIFVNINSFIANNTTYKKLPSQAELSSVILDMDQFVADKELTYTLAKCIEKAGVGILDIVLDAFALGKETAAIDASLKSSVIIVEIGVTKTLLSLYYHGRLISAQWLDKGYGAWVQTIINEHQLQFDVAHRLLVQNVDLKQNHYGTHPVFLWQVKEQTYTTNQAKIMECVESSIDQFINEVNEICQPIFAKSAGEYLLTGEGCLLEGLSERFRKITSVNTKVYVPETMGARDPGLTQVLGALYAYKDHLMYTNHTASCVNEVEFDTMLKSVKLSENQDGTLSKKVKGFFDSKKD
jgi:cell division protein FtsA